jgi:hypothetical protein
MKFISYERWWHVSDGLLNAVETGKVAYPAIALLRCSASLVPFSEESGPINLGGDSGDGTQRRTERFLS